MNTNKQGNKCAYFNCGVTARTNPSTKFFRFPKDLKRSREWIINCGNVEISHLDLDALYNRRLCEQHFKDDDFTSSARNRLTKYASPIPYTAIEVPTSPLVYANPSPPALDIPSPPALDIPSPPVMDMTSPHALAIPSPLALAVPSPSTPYLPGETLTPTTRNFIREIIDLPTPPKKRCVQNLFSKRKDEDTPRKIKLKKTILRQRYTLANKRSMISRLRKQERQGKKTKMSMLSFFESVNFSSNSSRTLAKMQIFHKSRQPWTPREKVFALKLFYKSPSAYHFLRNKMGITLPSKTVIKKWLNECNFSTGYNEQLFAQIKLKASTFTDVEKYCTIMFDEVRIKSSLEYSKYLDMVEGFVDQGFLGRENMIAKHALVFMARGLYAPWKMPLAYFLTGDLKAEDLRALIVHVIEWVFRAGLNVVAIICDQASTNRSTMNSFNMTPETPYFYVGDHKIFSIFDIPHVFKNYRNNLMKSNFLWENKEVSFSDIAQTYAIDKRSTTSRALLRITDSHIYPNAFEKMSCKRALQIFSNSVSAAMKTCILTKQLVTQTAENTASFLKDMNDLFDALNSSVKYSRNPQNCALSDECPQIKNTLLRARDMHSKIFKKVEEKKKPTPKLKKTRVLKAVKNKNKCANVASRWKKVPSFEGMIWSINAVLQIFEAQKEKGFSYLLTNRLNQDPLENLFSAYRQRGGLNKNPTARTLRTTFRINAVMSMMEKSDESNCKEDNDKHLLEETTSNDLNIEPPPASSSTSIEAASTFTSFSSTSTQKKKKKSVAKKITLDHCSNTYFAGYLFKKIQDKFNCGSCKDTLTTEANWSSIDQALIHAKTYQQSTNDSKASTKLNVPSEILTDFVTTCQNMIFDTVVDSPQMIGLRASILEKVNKTYANPITCDEHFTFLKKHLINTKLLRHFSTISKNLKDQRKTKSKLQILQGK